jgi:hypothetical protein
MKAIVPQQNKTKSGEEEEGKKTQAFDNTLIIEYS